MIRRPPYHLVRQCSYSCTVLIRSREDPRARIEGIEWDMIRSICKEGEPERNAYSGGTLRDPHPRKDGVEDVAFGVWRNRLQEASGLAILVQEAVLQEVRMRIRGTGTTTVRRTVQRMPLGGEVHKCRTEPSP
jgi:hypothetical protein